MWLTNSFSLSVMVIGFTERRKTVSESLVPGVDEFTLQIDVATLRESERLHRMLYRVLSSGTAEVVSFAFFDNLDFDARFGAVQADAIEGENQLLPGRDIINPLQTAIRNDFVPEDEECYSIQISPIDIPGLRELFMCDFVDTSLNPPMSFFCEHTICIEDDDGKINYIRFKALLVYFQNHLRLGLWRQCTQSLRVLVQWRCVLILLDHKLTFLTSLLLWKYMIFHLQSISLQMYVWQVSHCYVIML